MLKSINIILYLYGAKNRREVVCDTSVILVMIICTQHSKCIFVTKVGRRYYNESL